MSGTSMSAPLVAGSAALLWSAEPGLKGDIAGTSSVLTQTSRDKRSARCGGDRDAGTNNTYGFGVVDAKAAVDSVRVP